MYGGAGVHGKKALLLRKMAGIQALSPSLQLQKVTLKLPLSPWRHSTKPLELSIPLPLWSFFTVILGLLKSKRRSLVLHTLHSHDAVMTSLDSHHPILRSMAHITACKFLRDGKSIVFSMSSQPHDSCMQRIFPASTLS